ncbi:cyclic lactone autoinducer peptide, partial [Bacillus cereus group sp. BfR-BA-01517]
MSANTTCWGTFYSPPIP